MAPRWGSGDFWLLFCPLNLLVKVSPFSLPLFPSLSAAVRPRLSRSRRLSSPTCRSPSATSSRCRQRTPASAPTLASLTVSTAPRRAAGRRKWTNTATHFTSATILTRRYRPVGLRLHSSLCGGFWEGFHTKDAFGGSISGLLSN